MNTFKNTNYTVDTPAVYTVTDLAKILHIGRDKAYALMKSSGFPSFKLGKNYLVSINQFENWLENTTGRNYCL